MEDIHQYPCAEPASADAGDGQALTSLAVEAFQTFSAALAVTLQTTEQQCRAVWDFNRAAVIAALQVAGAVSASVEYSGGGDEGQTDRVAVEPATVCLTTNCVGMVELAYDWGEGPHDVSVKPVLHERPLDEALSELCDHAVMRAGHGYFHNGAGGRGTLTVNAATNEVLLEHVDFYTSEDVTEHAL